MSNTLPFISSVRARLARARRAAADMFHHSRSGRREGTVDDVVERLKRLENAYADEVKWRRIISQKLDVLIRRQAIEGLSLPYPYALLARRFRLRSQNEEDGVLMALLAEVGTSCRNFVELGSGGSGGNSALLAYELGWRGVMIEADPENARRARRRFEGNPGVVVACDFITPDNVNDLLLRYGVHGEVDVFSLDIDGDDYWVWEAVSVCSPRIAVIEYNAFFGPDRSVAVPVGACRCANRFKGYHGASLAALEKLGKKKGYRLVVCEEAGANAFFVRDDLAMHIPAVTARQAYRPLLERRSLEDVERFVDVFGECERRNLPLCEV